MLLGRLQPFKSPEGYSRYTERDAILDLLRICGKRSDQFGAVVELNEEEFVFWIGGLEELRGCLAGFPELRPHTTAGIELQGRAIAARLLSKNGESSVQRYLRAIGNALI